MAEEQVAKFITYNEFFAWLGATQDVCVRVWHNLVQAPATEKKINEEWGCK